MTYEQKREARLRAHPQILRSLLEVPNEQTIKLIISANLLDKPNRHLITLICSLLPEWEELACHGSDLLFNLICYLEQQVLKELDTEEDFLLPSLQRIRILASTPGRFPFSPMYIQEHLFKFLESSESVADLPELAVIAFSEDEILPLTSDLLRYKLHPHSRRFVQNLFYLERREAILSVLAFVAKTYPLLGTRRQAYSLMLSLDNPEVWSTHSFCLRLIANRFWELRLDKEGTPS